MITSSRIFKLLVVLAALAAAGAYWDWYVDQAPPDAWLIRIAIGALVAAVAVGLIGADTRPRLMLRFLAALFALVAVIAFAADVARPVAEGGVRGSWSLFTYLQNFAPSLLGALERTISRADPVVWDPVFTSIMAIPAYLLFAILAVLAGLAGRPRHRVQIFINDH